MLVSLSGALLVIMVIAMVADEADINGAEQREDCGLNEADEHLHEVENENEVSAVEQILAAEDIAEQAHGKREGTDDDREYVGAADDQEYGRQDRVEPAGSFAFLRLVAEEVEEENFRARELENDDQPRAE